MKLRKKTGTKKYLLIFDINKYCNFFSNYLLYSARKDFLNVSPFMHAEN